MHNVQSCLGKTVKLTLFVDGV